MAYITSSVTVPLFHCPNSRTRNLKGICDMHSLLIDRVNDVQKWLVGESSLACALHTGVVM